MLTEREIEAKLFRSFGKDLCVADASLLPIENDDAELDFAAILSIGETCATIIGEIESSGRPSRIRGAIAQLQQYAARHPRYLPVLVVPYLSERGRQMCKTAGVGYIDLSGNCYLKWGSLYVEKVGERKLPRQQRQSKRLFSDKASLILRRMLAEPHRLWGARELARTSGVSVSWAWAVLAGLAAADYAARAGRETNLSRPLDLLQDWADWFDFSRRNEIYSYFCEAPTSEALIDRIRSAQVAEPDRYALTLHAGASLVAPFARFHEVYLYVAPFADPSETEQWWMETLHLEKVDTGGNLYLVWPYYKHGAFYRAREINGVCVVSDIQLYVDLYNFPMRGREQAEHLMRRRLSHLLDGRSEQ
jgi:hypothetical protein